MDGKNLSPGDRRDLCYHSDPRRLINERITFVKALKQTMTHLQVPLLNDHDFGLQNRIRTWWFIKPVERTLLRIFGFPLCLIPIQPFNFVHNAPSIARTF